MSANAPFTPPKRKISVFWWIGAVVLLLVILFFVQLFGPSPKIVISKETTYVTEPLLPNGLPNYEEYLRQKLSEGVTPENNAAVLLCQALWPREIKDEEAELLVAELGLKELPSAETALQPMYGKVMTQRVSAWLKPQYTRTDGSGITPDADSVIDATMSYPWTSQQLPPMAEWLDANQKPLDMIVEASRRPRYYWPTPELVNNKPDMLVNAAMPAIQNMRTGSRGLKARAMRNIGENRLPEAWQDILALYRLSDLTPQYSSLVEQLVAMAIRNIANHGAQVLLSSPNMTKELAQQIRKDLAALPAAATTADSINRVERLFTLDAVLQIKSNGFHQVTAGTHDNSISPVDVASVDWNIVLTKINATFDDVVAALEQPDGEQREQALKDFEMQLNAEQQKARNPGSWAAALFSRNTRSELVGKIVVGMLLPAMQAANNADQRTHATFALTQLAAALAEYRAEHGKYPAKLDDLTPAILAETPTDLYARAYVYRRIDDGYLLYTTGSNGKDDGGSNETMNIFEGQEIDEMELGTEDAEGPQIPSGADDFSIRVPMPTFKLPEPMPAE